MISLDDALAYWRRHPPTTVVPEHDNALTLFGRVQPRPSTALLAA